MWAKPAAQNLFPTLHILASLRWQGARKNLRFAALGSAHIERKDIWKQKILFIIKTKISSWEVKAYGISFES